MCDTGPNPGMVCDNYDAIGTLIVETWSWRDAASKQGPVLQAALYDFITSGIVTQ